MPLVRERFGKGTRLRRQDDLQVRLQGQRPENVLASFRNSYNPRIAVTVDMIATGTDVKPLECVFLMSMVKSRNFFEQMKGRSVRVINTTDLKGVTPDAPAKDQFVIVDAVGVTEADLHDTVPLEREPTMPFHKLLQRLANGERDPDLISGTRRAKDVVVQAGFSIDAADRARRTVESFEQFIEEHKDEITALQVPGKGLPNIVSLVRFTLLDWAAGERGTRVH